MRTFYELQEGLNDPNIFKAFFLAGGPGSGKSYVVRQTTGGSGLVIINSDDAFEALLNKAGLDMKMPDAEFDKREPLRTRAKQITGARKENAVEGRLGLIIDGTGKNFGKIESQVKELRELGYDCYMVFVNTSKEVALERNNDRPRKLPEMMVSKMWSEVQENIGSFQRLFKAKRFEIVDNSKYGDTTPIDLVGKEIRKFMAQPVSNPIGKRWMKSQKKGK